MRLIRPLLEARHLRCIVLRGPAGCGKTTLALQFRSRLLPFGHGFAWVVVTPGMNFDGFAEQLLIALASVDPSITREARVIFDREARVSSPDEIAVPLLAGLRRWGRDLVLAIDDLHTLEDPQPHQLLQTLLDFAHTNLHFLIITRGTPAVSVVQPRDTAQLLEIDFAALRFTFAETEQMLLAQRPGLSRGAVRRIYDTAQGWAAGLRLSLVGLHADSRMPQSAPPRAAPRAPEEFERYFEKEVFALLSPEEAQVAVQLSAAQRFNEALSAEVCDPHAGPALVLRMLRDQMFLVPDETGPERWYRLHPLLRELLRARFDALPLAQREAVHDRLAGWFSRHRMPLDATRHAVAAGRAELAAEWVERDAPELFVAGEMRRLVRALALLPPALVAARASLRLWAAWSKLCLRDLQGCADALGTLRTLVQGRDRFGEPNLTLLDGCLAIQQDDADRGETLRPALERLPALDDAILAGGRRNFLGWLHIHHGRFERAREVLAGPAHFLGDGSPLMDSAFGHLQTQCMHGYCSLCEGEVARAELELRDALTAADRLLGIYGEASCNAAGLLGTVLYERDRLDALRDLLEPRFDVILKVGLPEAIVGAFTSRIRMLAAEGGWNEAACEAERLEELASQRGLRRLLAHALHEQSLLRQQAGDARGSAIAVARLEELAAVGTPTGPAGRAIRHLAFCAKLQRLAAQGAWSEAEREIDRSWSALSFDGDARREVGALALRAMVEARCGREQAAQANVAHVLARARRLGICRTLLDVGPPLLDVADQALAAGQLDASSAFQLAQLKLHARPAGSPATGVCLDMPAEPLSEREQDVLRALARTMANKRIANALGVSPETVKWHLKNIYGKLGVYDRDAAVARARHLGLIDTA